MSTHGRDLVVGLPRDAFRPSPIFVALVALLVTSGWMTWAGFGNVRLDVFLFVIAGWLVSLCLHEYAHAVVAYRAGDVAVAHRGYTHVFRRPRAVDAGTPAVVSDGTVTAPMPGTVLSVAVEPGQRVDAGQLLGVVEAMKMELALTAPFAGTVTSVAAAAGAGVALGAPLFTVEEVR